VAHAAWSISEDLSIQDFALDWFGNGGVPLAHLKNTAKTIDPNTAGIVKERFKAAVHAGDLFVSGADWEYQMIQGEQAASSWLEAKNYGIGDIARFFDCPGDVIDAAVSSGNITYANVVQRNLQLLIMHIGPAILRREAALTDLLPAPRSVKLKRDALLEMDPLTRVAFFKSLIDSRSITPDEIRAEMNRQALTQDQIEQLLTFFPPRGTTVEAGSGLESVAATPAL
jgi:phage portal protein BeeE